MVAVDSGCVSKTKFTDQLNMGYKRKRNIKYYSKVSVLLVPQVSTSLCMRPFPELQRKGQSNNSYHRLEVLGN